MASALNAVLSALQVHGAYLSGLRAATQVMGTAEVGDAPADAGTKAATDIPADP